MINQRTDTSSYPTQTDYDRAVAENTTLRERLIEIGEPVPEQLPSQNSDGAGDVERHIYNRIVEQNNFMRELLGDPAQPTEPERITQPHSDLDEAPISDFEYRFDAEYGGIVITRYIGTSIRVRIPAIIEDMPVVAISGFEESGIMEVYIPNGVTSIQQRAFYWCRGLVDITIPDSVYSIGRDAFAGSAWFEAQPDGVVYAGRVAIAYKGDMNGVSIILEDGTTGIGDGAFGAENIAVPQGETFGLASIILPNSVRHIGLQAFQSNIYLSSIQIPDSVVSIGRDAFSSMSEGFTATYKGITYNTVGGGNGGRWHMSPELYDTINRS